jgi:hypothetical protein
MDDEKPAVAADGLRRLRRWLLVGGGIVVGLLLVVGVTVLVLRARDSTTTVSVDDALGSFREADAAASAAIRSPEPGVYVYETVGDEQVDALGGATHTYPAETTMTITSTDCGYRVRWDVFEERFDELDMCLTPDGESIAASRQHRQFFGITNDRTYRCDDTTTIRSEPPAPGDARSTTCWAGPASADMTVTVVGPDVVSVGGRSLDALHIRLQTELDGDVRGTSILDYWIDATNGLILRRESQVTTDADSPLGVIEYDETYTVQLVTTEPRR